MNTDSAPQAQPLPALGAAIPYERFLDCVHCGLCTSACPTYLQTGDENLSPRGRIYLMRALVDGRLELTKPVERALETCLDCRSCETACPSGVQYGRLIEPFRVDMHRRQQESGSSSGWFTNLILHRLFPYPDRMKWALLPARWMQFLRIDRAIEWTGLIHLLPERLKRMHRLLPELHTDSEPIAEFYPAKGPRRAKVALFTGCVASVLFSRVHRATIRVLQANGCDVVVPRDQVCCGAIHYHSGAAAPAVRCAQVNAQVFNKSDVDAVIVNVAGCGAMMKEYSHTAAELVPGDHATIETLTRFSSRVRDIAEFLCELGPIPPAKRIERTVTYHDACHLCHAQKIREQPRSLLSLIPGLKVIPLKESEICCGAAGSYNLTEGEMADQLARRKIDHILATGADAVLTGNAGCSLQIQAELRAADKPIPVLHPVELLDESYGD